jgi:hypothetical protein
LIWNFKNLRAPEGTQNQGKKGKGTLNVPALFPSKVGIAKPMSGRIGTDAKASNNESRSLASSGKSFVMRIILNAVAA